MKMSHRLTSALCILAVSLLWLAQSAAADLTAAIKISPTQAAWDYPVVFDALGSTLPEGVSLADLDIAWEFGDGGTGSGAQVTHTYTGKGKTEYMVKLMLTKQGSTAVSETQTTLPVGSQVSGEPLMTLIVPLKNATVVADDVVTIELAIDRATSGAEIDPTTFAATLGKTNLTPLFAFVTDPARGGRIVGARGTIPINQFDLSKKKQTVKMVVESQPFTASNGNVKRVKDQESAQFAIAINHRPISVFDYEPAAPDAGQVISFDATASTDPEGQPLTYSWDYGDGSTGSGALVTHSYATAGDYRVSLSVSDGVWPVTSAQVVRVSPPNEPPEACFTFDSAAPSAGKPVTFNATCSSDPEEQPLTFTWDFGDGSLAMQTTALTVSHTFATQGSYDVELTVSDGVKQDTTTQPVVVSEAGPLLTVTPGGLDFGDLDRDLNIRQAPMRSDRLMEISNGGGGVLEVSAITSSDPSAFPIVAGAVAQGEPMLTLGPGERHYVNVQFRPRVDNDDEVVAKDWAATLTVISNADAPGVVPLNARTVDTIAGQSLRLMRFYYTSGRGPLPGAVLGFGDVDITAKIDEDGISNQGTDDVQVTGVSIVDDETCSFSATMNPPAGFTVRAGNNGRSGGFFPAGAEIAVAFTPTTTDPEAWLRAKLIIATSSGSLEVGLTGVGRYRCNLSVSHYDFEFERVNINKSTGNIGNGVGGADDFLYPATARVRNGGRIGAGVAATIDSLYGGASQFAVAPDFVTVGGTSNPVEVDLQLSFSPTSEGHKSALLRLVPTCLDGSLAAGERIALLHGYPKNSSAEKVLGTTETWYTIEDSYHYDDNFDYVKMLRLKSDANAQAFGDLVAIPDPFLKSDPQGNRVDTDQWEYEQSDLAVYGDAFYIIDSDLFGPYFPNDSENTVATEQRLATGDPIGSGGLLKGGPGVGAAVFVADIDGNDDIRSEGLEDLELDVTADGTQFYTETTDDGAVVHTALKWQQGGAKAVLVSDLSTLLGAAGAESVDLRVLQVTGGYRAFVLLDNNSLHAVNLNTAGVVSGTANLTASLSEVPDETMRLDGAGNRLTTEDDGSGTITVYKEDLYAGTGKQVFGQVTLPFDDRVFDVLGDKLGNVFVSTANGVYWFGPSGTPQGYILAGDTFYSDNLVGNNSDDKNAEWYLDFERIWFAK